MEKRKGNKCEEKRTVGEAFVGRGMQNLQKLEDREVLFRMGYLFYDNHS